MNEYIKRVHLYQSRVIVSHCGEILEGLVACENFKFCSSKVYIKVFDSFDYSQGFLLGY